MSGTIDLEAKYSFTVGGPNDRTPEITLALAAMGFVSESVKHLDYGAPVVDEDIFNGTVGTAKVVVITSSLQGGDIKVNNSDAIPIAEADGWFMYVNPAGGITSLLLTTTAAAKFKVMMFS
jgi:hypothetical protein